MTMDVMCEVSYKVGRRMLQAWYDSQEYYTVIIMIRRGIIIESYQIHLPCFVHNFFLQINNVTSTPSKSTANLYLISTSSTMPPISQVVFLSSPKRLVQAALWILTCVAVTEVNLIRS